jgi:hypothetical protein
LGHNEVGNWLRREKYAAALARLPGIAVEERFIEVRRVKRTERRKDGGTEGVGSRGIAVGRALKVGWAVREY